MFCHFIDFIIFSVFFCNVLCVLCKLFCKCLSFNVKCCFYLVKSAMGTDLWHNRCFMSRWKPPLPRGGTHQENMLCCPSVCKALYLFPLQRKRHYWRLDSKCITLFQNDTGSKYYKVRNQLRCYIDYYG